MRSVPVIAGDGRQSPPSLSRLRLLVFAALFSGLSACGLLPAEIDQTADWSAARLYTEAKSAFDDNNWEEALKYYQKLESRYPYGRYAQQAQMEAAYARWKDGDEAAALADCDRFIRLHPNHPSVDYMYYLKGLITFNGDLGYMGYLSSQDQSERDPRSAQESFDALRELVTRFPQSKYAPDAQARMNYLVNMLSAHEVHVARYYLKRGAYLAAINRGQYAIKTYPNTPALEEASYILVLAYDKLDMPELRDDALRVMRLNFPDSRYYTQGLEPKKPWWNFF